MQTYQNILQEKLLKLDIEYGNARGFFSADKCGIRGLDAEKEIQINNYKTSIPGAAINITDSVDVVENNLVRSTKFEVQAGSKLFDMVSRFVVLSNDRVARIEAKEIKHKSRNIYHQYSTNDVLVPVGLRGYLQFKDNGSAGHPLFENVFYIRDETVEQNGMRRWIVHHRMIVNQKTANLIVRCCHPMLEGPLPLQGIIPNALRKKLFRIRERKMPNFPFMAVGESIVSAKHDFDIRTFVKYSE